jgi:hypothetical protein
MIRTHLFEYKHILLRIQAHSLSKKEYTETSLLYSQRANRMISKKVAKFIRLIKRFRTL